jgi:murein DD-endopeptidase MepM/ murein hydrolase activator NlpD
MVENKEAHRNLVAKNSFSSNPFKVKAKNGETLYDISKQYGVGLRELIELNKLRPPYALEIDQYVRLPQATFHIVKPKDTLYAISRSYGLDIGRIVHLNNLIEPYKIRTGTKLLLPSSAYPTELASANPDDDVKLGHSTDMQEPNNHSRDVVANDLVVLGSGPEKIATSSLPDAKSEEIVPTGKAINKSNEVALGDEIKAHDLKEKNKTDEVILGGKVKKSVKDPAPESEEVIFTGAVAKKAGNVLAAKPVESVKMPSKIIVEENTPAPKSFPIVQTENALTEFLWPTKGKIVSQFGPKQGGLYNDGINIAAKEGASIKAADKGEVVYSGNELRGYGNLVLVKHANGFVTAYAHAQKIVVKKGDEVEKGQTIAYVGNTGHVSKPQLHFSIRKGRKALDPQKYLPTNISMN